MDWGIQLSLRAVLIDLGDVIMSEETEEKIDTVTQRADLVPGMSGLLRHQHTAGVPLALVADTRVGTYQNVLRQHGVFDLFDAFAISDELGCEKPDPGMFRFALDALQIPEVEWADVVMVGNNLARDIRGANALGLTTIWFAWNQRYSIDPADDAETPTYQVGSASELGQLLDMLHRGDDDLSMHRHPRAFPWA